MEVRINTSAAKFHFENIFEAQRPDLLANRLYETSELWWVFAIRNPDILTDPIRDFKTGVTIALPSAESVMRSTGG